MAKTVFKYGVPITPELLNALGNHDHRGEDRDGSSPKITNSDLTLESGHILSDFYSHYRELKVEQATALKVKVYRGVVLLPTGRTRAIEETELQLADNSIQFIFVDQTGLLRVGQQTELGSQLLARVQTSSGATTLVEDLRQRTVTQLPLQSGQSPVFVAPLDQLALFDSAQDINQATAVSIRLDGRVEKLNQSNWKKWIGFTELSSVQGSKCRVALPGRVCAAFSRLMPGQDYYVQYTTGSLILTRSVTSFYCGRALSQTSLLLAQTQP